MMEEQPYGDASTAQKIAQTRARLEAGEHDAAGPLGELLARSGDRQGAIQVWGDAYGQESPSRKRLAELLAREGRLDLAVSVWEESLQVWHNPISLYSQHLARMSDEERTEALWDEPEEMAGTLVARLGLLFDQQGEEAVIAQLRVWETRPHDLSGLPQ